MSLYDLKQALQGLQHAADTAIKRGVDLKATTPKNVVYDFGASKTEYYKKSVIKYLDQVRRKSSILSTLLTIEKNAQYLPEIMNTLDELKLEDLEQLRDKSVEVLLRLRDVKSPTEERITTTPTNIPNEIKGDILADLQEIDKAYRAACYRSVTILCGRILETALHRKYFDSTGQDILETNPGVGLGKLIAKLAEKGARMDPALNNQIHLINQVRIHSVHKKQEPFLPSSTQAKAMVLYMNDVLEKLF
ncbi:MAG: hypothetical protein ACE5FT_01395 [Candidatus Nanoarchaeia archaeon]